MKINKLATVVTALAVATIFDLISVAKPVAAATLVGLTDNNTLVLFDSSTPTATTSTQVTGLNGTLLGIDRRPANNKIYGLTTTNEIYTINPFTGAATFVSTLSVPFNGGNISGVDFNPVPDRLRVVGSNDQNYRINVDTGAVIVDGTLNPGDPNITAVAYTNADINPATGTTLYDIDYILDALFIQNPPNNGTLVQVGSLGIDIDSAAGFDIFTNNGVNTAFAALTPASASGSILYNINLTTGAATSLGTIGSEKRLIGLTVVAVPEPSISFGSFLGVSALALLGCYRRRLKLVN
ncbi:DUF4394 domain-containing protein [Cylindrospermum sp. FACHB-282]|uniref:DUF4394 domain-containing protein n=1 Tax=Cylindrospermum sp. FACHB-282 TaxID=2692794 RepID=UPI00168489A1|nr:DUF4394 domain-containing protein [Cylindrospermum sp. FACHB-282]MBD2384100.1 DUF4394 domain-containing protein [Cylindrospermum sp. FACHB-282]